VDFACLDRKPVRIVLACLKRDNVDLLGLKPMFYLLRMLRSDEYRHKFLDVRTENDIYRLWKELTSGQ
jgi:mannitol/fructose-specific phosphotransferase system IIA component (Ntr-type)